MSLSRAALHTLDRRLVLHEAAAAVRRDDFANDVRRGLGEFPKQLPPKYFYDALGSALFEAITELPEYYLTRAETEILEREAAHIVATALAEKTSLELIELGSGSARKTRAVLDAAFAGCEQVSYKPIDISPSALRASAIALLGDYPRLEVEAFADDYFAVLDSGRLRTQSRALVLFLGSNVGNYEPATALSLLRAIGAELKAGDGILMGYDLKKDPAVLELAYNDPTGVTAAFNRNVLGRINRELGGEFDLDAFRHVARYSPARSSVDSFLVAERSMRVRVAAAGIEVRFSAFEAIHTESSYKFDETDAARLAERAGLRVTHTWRDPGGRFALSLLAIV